LRNPKKWKPDAIWQNLLRKAMALKGYFSSEDEVGNDEMTHLNL
jgi:hypothetical protein